MINSCEKMIEELAVYDEKRHTTIFCNAKEKYVIPLYQRAYAWTDTEIEQLIDDIVEHNGDRYYIGSLIVYKRSEEYEVIDGQQRLTTLLLLAIELGLPVKNNLSFACRKRADDTLSHYIDGKEILDDDLEQNIVQGRKIIAEKLLSDGIDRTVLIHKLAHLKLFRIQVPPRTDLNRYFEIMNTRGEQLEQHDILKASLISEIGDDAKRDMFAKIWDACSDMTGYMQMHFDVPTRNLIFTNSWNWLDENFEDWIEENGEWDDEPELTLDEILSPGFKVQYNDGSTDKNERVRFESIIDFQYFLLHVLRVYIDANHIQLPDGEELQRLLDDKKLISEFERVLQHGTYGRRRVAVHKEHFAWNFVLCLLKCRFLFDKYIIKREYANESADGEWSLKQLEVSGQESKKKAYFKNTELRDHKEWRTTSEPRSKEAIMLQSALRVSYTSPKVMHWITELLIWLYNDKNRENWWKFNSVAEQIAKDAVIEGFFDINNLCMGVNTPHIVFNYLDYLLWKNNKRKYADFVFEFRNSVEHWYPQHPSEGTFEMWGQDEVDHFGNLCIIQRSVNSRFSNMAPAAKKSTFGQMIRKGSLKLRLMAEMTSSGTDANIKWKQDYDRHGQEMIGILKNACGID